MRRSRIGGEVSLLGNCDSRGKTQFPGSYRGQLDFFAKIAEEQQMPVSEVSDIIDHLRETLINSGVRMCRSE